jgi:hypothetical protein
VSSGMFMKLPPRTSVDRPGWLHRFKDLSLHNDQVRKTEPPSSGRSGQA